MASSGRPPGLGELKIFPNAPQPSHQRFPSSLVSWPPELGWYRNNLVALSQYYNLFFVASLDEILVYQPIGHDQYLINPCSTIKLARSRNDFIGYMDAANPHAIDQLVVADLGLEEILVAVCDDGDVVAYTTRPIQREIDDRAPDPHYRPNNFDSQVRPFFIVNVGMSAWGIAVHKEARMIAISSNSKKIHVFAFALNESCSTPDTSSETDILDGEILGILNDEQWIRHRPYEMLDPKDRSNNIEIVLSNHWNNIPSIAFFNNNRHGYTSSDKTVYLVSTDIDHHTYVWDVWRRTIITQLTAYSGDLRGWGVACIDPYFCRPAFSIAELYGTLDLKAATSLPTSAPKPRQRAPFPFHVLHTDQCNIRLLTGDPNCRRDVSATAPLRTYPQFEFLDPQSGERLNMVLQVPELELAIVADQMGRVALLTLTRWVNAAGEGENAYGFRFEHFVPLKAQEVEGARPKSELAGVAVGPVAGWLRRREDEEDDEEVEGRVILRPRRRRRTAFDDARRRYRLLLYYMDHAVLSYEIWRRTEEYGFVE